MSELAAQRKMERSEPGKGRPKTKGISEGSPPWRTSGIASSLPERRDLMPAREPILIFLFFLLTYILTAGGHLYSLDEEKLFLVTKSMVEEGSFQLGDGNFSCYGLGPSLLAVPFYMAGKIISAFLPGLDTLEASRGVCSTFNSFVTALTCVIFFKLWRAFSISSRTAFLSTLLYGFGTLAWPYSKYFFPQPLAGLCLLGAAYGLFQFSLTQDKTWILRASFWTGFLFLTRPEGILFFPIGLGYLYFKDRNRRILSFLSFSFFPVIFIIFGLLYNYIRSGYYLSAGYGSSLNDYSTPLLIGLYGNLLSPGKGILMYMPVILLPVIGFRFFKHRAEAVLILMTALFYLILYSKWWDWSGDWSWGPRLLVMIIPLFFIPAAFLLEKVKWKSLAGILILILSLTSILVSLISLPISFNEYLREAYRVAPLKTHFLGQDITLRPHHFIPQHSPLVAQVRLIKERITAVRAGKELLGYDYHGRQIKLLSFDFWYVNLCSKVPPLRKPILVFLILISGLWIFVLSLIIRMIKYNKI